MPKVNKSFSFKNMKDYESMSFLRRMEIDTQERVKKKLSAEKIGNRFKKNKSLAKLNNQRKTVADLSVKKLYDDAFIFEQKIKNKVDRFNTKIKQKIVQKKTSTQTDKIVSSKINHQIQRLFEMLDGDRDGLISSNRMDLANLNSQRLKILSPVLLEIEENEAVLTADEFKYAIKRLLKVIQRFNYHRP